MRLHPNLVFLHGIACTRQVWDPLLAKLPKTWGASAPNLRFHGEGRLADRDGFSVEDFALDIINALRQSEFRPAWLVGHSMGARIAVAAAMHLGEEVEGLVLVDHPLSIVSEEGRRFRDRFREFLEKLPLRFLSQGFMMKYLREKCPDASSSIILCKSYVDTPNGGVELQVDKEAILRAFDFLPKFPFSESLHSLGRLGKPVMVLRGEASPFWSHEDWLESCQSFGKYRSFKFLEIEGVSHALPFEREDRFMEELHSFICQSIETACRVRAKASEK